MSDSERIAIEEIKSVLPTLNDSQLEAISSTEGPVLILAGPGTGKTLTMVARTLFLLLSQKAKPEEIILTTFTEKAAFELRDRVSQLARKVGYSGQLHSLKTGTIHSLCNSFIMKHLHCTNLRKGYIVLDELTQMFFVYEHFDEIAQLTNGKFLGKWGNKWEAITCLISYLNKITEEMIEPAKLYNSGNPFLEKIAKAYETYRRKLFENNKVDFAHLQKIFFDLLNNEKIYTQIKANIKYIMVDEYQDTNYIQEQILFKLAFPQNNICVVGDEDQSLYRFRGATVRNILEFPKHFQNCKQIKLTINYRSHKEIIEKCNKFITSIDWDKFRFPKKIEPNPDEKFDPYPAVFCIWGIDEQDEVRKFLRLLNFLKDHEIISDWSDVALLLKSVRYDSEHYIQGLKAANIPYFAPRARRFFQNEEIQLLLACYAIIWGFHSEKIAEFSRKEVIEEGLKFLNEKLNPPLKDYLKRRAKQIEALREGSLDLTPLDYFYQLLAYEPFATYLRDKNRAHNLSIFSKLLGVFQDYYGISLITASNKAHLVNLFFNSFLDFLMGEGVDEYEDPDNPIPKGYVQIMTIHQSKGLEFPVVIVGSLHKSFRVQKEVDRYLLPFSKRGTFETEEQMTKFDRIRHYYVAFSRAQKLLVLTTSRFPQPWFSPIWEGLDQYPYIEEQTLKAQKFISKPQFIPKKSYSLSHINIYEICPYQYLFYTEYNFQPSRSAQVLFGSLVHYTIEDIHRAVLDRRNFTTSDIEEWFEGNYRALILSGLRPIGKTQKEIALRQVINYYLQNEELMQRIYEAEVDVTVEKEEYIISGKVDLLLAADGKLEVLDFKTQPKPSPNSPLIDMYFKQLCLYAYILRERYAKPIEKLYIYWTVEEERKEALMELRYSDKDIDEAGRHFDEVVKRIRAEDFLVRQEPDTEKVCKECDFRFYCAQNGVIRFKTKVLSEV